MHHQMQQLEPVYDNPGSDPASDDNAKTGRGAPPSLPVEPQAG